MKLENKCWRCVLLCDALPGCTAKVKNGRVTNYLLTWGSQTCLYTATQLADGVNIVADLAANPFLKAFSRVDQATWQDSHSITSSTEVDTNGASMLATYWSGSAGSLTVNGVKFSDAGSVNQTQNRVTASPYNIWQIWSGFPTMAMDPLRSMDQTLQNI